MDARKKKGLLLLAAIVGIGLSIEGYVALGTIVTFASYAVYFAIGKNRNSIKDN